MTFRLCYYFLKMSGVLKTVLITGACEGIGFQTALALAQRNYQVIMTDKKDLTKSKEHIVKLTKNINVKTKYLDLSSFTCIRSFVEDFLRSEPILNILINNAGIFSADNTKTVDGLIPTMQINHFGPFLLTHLLLDLLKKSAPSRVIFVSSIGAFFHKLTLENLYNPDKYPLPSVYIYYNSKLCNIIVANGFANKIKDSGVTFNSLHPGMTGTKLLKLGNSLDKILKQFTKDSEAGAQNSIFLATSSNIEYKTGKFFVDLKEYEQPRIVDDANFCNHLWDYSKYFTKLN